MRWDFNQVVISGRIARHPTILKVKSYVAREKAKGRKFKVEPTHVELEDADFCRFLMACNQDNKPTVWVWVITFGKEARQIRDYGGKGTEIIINGELKCGRYNVKTGLYTKGEDEEKGVYRHTLAVLAKSITFHSTLKAHIMADHSREIEPDPDTVPEQTGVAFDDVGKEEKETA